MISISDASLAIADGFERAGCTGFLHAVSLSTGAEIGLDADAPVVMASVVKVLIGLEFYAQAADGALDPARIVEITPKAATPGPTGLSNFEDPARLSLRDLAQLVLTLSDNAATDAITAAVGLEAVNRRAALCGCQATRVESDLATMLQGVAAHMGFASYAELVRAQAGDLGDAARARSLDGARLETCPALDPRQATRTTARDMTRLLAAIWADRAAKAAACRRLRETMARQVTRRLEFALPDGGALAAKSGGLFGRVRNEVGVITHPDGEAYAVAVFTRARRPFVGTAAINAQMAEATRTAIEALRTA